MYGIETRRWRSPLSNRYLLVLDHPPPISRPHATSTFKSVILAIAREDMIEVSLGQKDYYRLSCSLEICIVTIVSAPNNPHKHNGRYRSRTAGAFVKSIQTWVAATTDTPWGMSITASGKRPTIGIQCHPQDARKNKPIP